MKNKTTRLLSRFNVLFFLMLISLVSITLFSSCEKEDDIPPVSAYVEPEPPEGCVLVTVVPEFGEEAVDFDCEAPEFEVFGQAAGDITATVVDNPVSGGINTSLRVVEVVQTPGVEVWAGLKFELAGKIDFTANRTIKIKVYSPAVGHDVLLKLEDKTDGSINKEVIVPTTVANTWEELSFIFSPDDNDKYDLAVLFFNFLGAKDVETTHYFDDIVVVEGDGNGGGGGDDVPTTAAPDPILPDTDVISIFSDVYTNISGTDFNPDWGQATVVTEEDIAGNNTLKYENLNYQGTAFASPLDVSGMSFLHLDYWTADSTGFNTFLISTGPLEAPHAESPTTGEWVSLDIPLSTFSSVVDLMDVIQMKFDGDGTLYLDNIYFHNGQPTGPTTAAPTPTLPDADVISIFSDAYTTVSGIDYNPNWGQATVVTQEEIAGNNTLKYENLNYQGTQFDAIDVSGKDYLHIDYWTADSTGFNAFLISPGPAEASYAESAPTTGEWVSLDIPLSTFSSVVDLMDVFQMKFDGNGTIYLDNIYFYNEQANAPTTAAPTPSLPDADVISVFSDAYTTISGIDYNPNWGQATVVTQEMIAGNNTLKYENLNYQGTQFDAIDVSGKTMLHIDYWTADSTELNGYIISPGPAEAPHAFEITTGEWVSVDIPLTTFSGVVDLADVFQMKFDGNGTIYLDNIYFH